MPNDISLNNPPSPQPSPRIPGEGAAAFSRRRFFKQLTACATLPLAAGIYANRIEPFWPRYFEYPITIKNLPKSFEGFRIAQITDMHAGRAPTEYLQKVVDHLNGLKPDIVVVTGDLLHHNPWFIDAIAQLLGTFSMPVFASFGNHDYAPPRGEEDPYDPELNDKLRAAIQSAGCTPLKNQSFPIHHADGPLWIVGLDDFWFGDFNPQLAFQDVPSNEPVIALSHNPDTAELLAPHGPDLILSGHTHGGQIRLPYYGAIRLNVAHPQYDMGHFQIANSQLFVSTGVGYIRKIRFNCRPEVPIFVLRG